jgi:hypothetical protein
MIFSAEGRGFLNSIKQVNLRPMAADESPRPSTLVAPILDPLTIAAMAWLAYVISDVVHEAIGHGVVSVLVGGKAQYLSSMNYVGDHKGLPIWCTRMVSAGGTIVNLVVGLIAVTLLKSARRSSAHSRYFLWLLAAVNLFAGTGYFMFSGFGGIGDWANFIAQLPGYWAWRVGLAVFGLVTYGLTMYWMMHLLESLLGPVPAGERLKLGYKLCLIPYFFGAALDLVAGLFNPGGGALLLISAAASSLGGMCGFVWGPQFLRGSGESPAEGEPLALARNWIWIFSALIIGAFFIGVLGPGIHFASKG